MTWNTILHDGFDGSALNRQLWPNVYDGILYWNSAFYWEADMVSVRDGSLRIGMQNRGDGIWNVGAVAGIDQGSRGLDFTYGRVEVRAKTSAEVIGAGPCFLLWPANDSWPPEIDFLETPASGNGMFTNHWPGPGGGPAGRGYTSKEWALDHSQWHTYTLDWFPDRITLYVDGQHIHTFTDNIPTMPMSIALQGHVGRADDNWYLSPNGRGQDYVEIEVDYVKVEQWTGGGTAPMLSAKPPEVIDPVPARPPVTLTVGTGPDALVLRMSQEYFQGDAEYVVRVDGKQVGGTLTASALKGAGADTVTVRGDWVAGVHRLEVEFLNDLFGGSAAADRNLHLEGATYNGVAVPGMASIFWGSGTQGFDFTEAPPALPPAPTMVGTAGRDTLTGTSGNDVIDGLAGNDVLRGATSHDWLLGGDGDDRMVGGRGDDILTLGAGRDVAIHTRGEGHDRITDFVSGTDRLELRSMLPGEVTLRLTDAGLLVSTAGGGSVLLEGVTSTGAGDITAAGLAVPAFAAKPVLPATANTVNGTAGDDWLAGTAGADLLLGGAGEDDLQGGAGNDVLRAGKGPGLDGLTGGEGQDVFVFARGDGQDWVVDFARGQDRVWLEGVAANEVTQVVETRWGQQGLAVNLGQGEGLFLAGITQPLGAADLVFA
jgi:Ca2+-binding RTX toxin-like protein